MASSDKELRDGQLDDACHSVKDSCRLQNETAHDAGEDANLTLKLPPKPEPPKVVEKRKPADAEGSDNHDNPDEFSSSDDSGPEDYLPSLPLTFKSSSMKAKAKGQGGARCGAGLRSTSATPKQGFSRKAVQCFVGRWHEAILCYCYCESA